MCVFTQGGKKKVGGGSSDNHFSSGVKPDIQFFQAIIHTVVIFNTVSVNKAQIVINVRILCSQGFKKRIPKIKYQEYWIWANNF